MIYQTRITKYPSRYNAPSRYQSWKIIDFQNVNWFLAFISLYLKWFLKSSEFASQINKAINWNSTLAIFVWFWNQYGGFVYITKKKWLTTTSQPKWLTHYVIKKMAELCQVPREGVLQISDSIIHITFWKYIN